LLAVNRGKISALDTYRKEITKKVEDEIIKRYFYRDGLYDYNLDNDDAILTAVELFKKEQKYNAILLVK
jgi:carboxyl-terminal processing protease